MGRLIDADELRKRLLEGVWNDLIKELDDMPTVDVVPVVHGRWVTVSYNNGKVESQKCSICEGEWFEGFAMFAYCPDCGAKMDLEEE